MIRKVAALIQRCARCLQAGVSVSMLGMFAFYTVWLWFKSRHNKKYLDTVFRPLKARRKKNDKKTSAWFFRLDAKIWLQFFKIHESKWITD